PALYTLSLHDALPILDCFDLVSSIWSTGGSFQTGRGLEEPPPTFSGFAAAVSTASGRPVLSSPAVGRAGPGLAVRTGFPGLPGLPDFSELPGLTFGLLSPPGR